MQLLLSQSTNFYPDKIWFLSLIKLEFGTRMNTFFCLLKRRKLKNVMINFKLKLYLKNL